MKTPLEKATTLINIVDASVDLLTPIATFVVVDMGRVEREVLKGSIADSDVQKLLPFHTMPGWGKNFIHIVNRSAYIVETNNHIIREGETLCKRAGGAAHPYYGESIFETATCPGCLAKGKSIIVNHLYKTCI